MAERTQGSYGYPYEMDPEVQRVPGLRKRDLVLPQDGDGLGRMAARRAAYVSTLAELMRQAQREAVAEAWGWGLDVDSIADVSGIRRPTIRRLLREAGVEDLRGQAGAVLGVIAEAHRVAPTRRDLWERAITKRTRRR